MVKTRNKSSVAEQPTRVSTRRSARAEAVDSHNSEDSDDEDRRRSTRRLKFSDDESASGSSSLKPSSALPMKRPGRPQSRLPVHSVPNGRHQPSRRRDSPHPPPAHNIAGLSTDDDMNEDDDSAVRRSTRHRKCIYGNLNQTWILTSNLPDFVKVSSEQPSKRSKKDPSNLHHYLRSSTNHRHESTPPGGNDSETLDGDNEDSLESKRSNDKANVNKELRRLGLSEMQSFSEDMYSRVKRTRQQHQVSTSATEEPPFFRTRSSRRAAAEERRERRHGEATAAREGGRSDSEESAEEGDSGDSDEEGEEGEGPLPTMNGYHLRPKKPVTERFQVPVGEPRGRSENKRSKRITSIFHTPKHDRNNFRSPAHRSPMYRRKRHATHNSSSTSSSSDDECRFERRKARSMVRARNRCLPLNFQEKDLFEGVRRDRAKIGTSLADVDPMQVDQNVKFDQVGGLDSHIQQLKEMILFPLIYPEVFERFKISPPRGVLFYGPPGTGKTLVARALANECSHGDSRVAFFMRKGADCLSKWVGESERQLRLLFDQAYSMRPSIIFFDEIDGLAPVRSTRQDQIHSSIVSTLLALMDGLDSRGEVVIIGATNRIDAIDPALRRPGRFDREFHFALPCHKARLSILEIHTRDWRPAPSPALLSELAARCTGYCGADLKALCSEAALVALRRSFPQIYASKEKLQLNIEAVQILPEDYDRAMRKIVPASQRCGASPARPLSVTVHPLLCQAVEKALIYLQRAFATGLHKSSIAQRLRQDGNQTDDSSGFSDDEAMDSTPVVDLTVEASDRQSLIPSIRSRFAASASASHRPRLLICGRPGLGQTTHVAPAVLHLLEHLPLHRLDLSALHSVTARAPEEACAQVLQEAQRVLPSVLYLPHVCQWWDTLGDAVRATFLTLLSDLEPLTPVLWLATADEPFDQLPSQVRQLFGPSEVLELRAPSESERRRFFAPVFARAAAAPRPKRPTPEQMPSLPAAPPPEPRKLTPTELERLRQQEEATLRELRLFLRDILTKLMRDRRYSMFAKPVDASEVPDYLEVIREPMDMETMMVKIDRHQYQTVAQFLQDIELICSNALEYNPDRDPMDKNIRHRACALQDAAHALVDTELDWGFEKICQDILQARKERGEQVVPYVPKNYYVVPRTAAQPTTNGLADDPAQVDALGEDGRKRFSRRLRGMEVVPSDNEEDTAGNTTDATQEADYADGGSSQTTASQQPTVEVTDAPVENQSTKPASVGRDKVAATRTATKRRRSSSDGGSKNSDSSRPQAAAKEKPTAAGKRPAPPASSPDQTEDSNESQQKQVASPNKGRVSEVSCNGAVAEEAPSRELQLNRGWLEELEERTVAQTEGATVEQLERLHCALLNVVRRHRRSWDRSVMLLEMSQQLDSFKVLLRNQAAT